MKMIRAHLIVEGRVQGVYYRANTADTANKHDVCGWVKNYTDGTVEAMLEGEAESVERVIAWCRVGPPRARVDTVKVEYLDYSGEFDGFSAITSYNTY